MANFIEKIFRFDQRRINKFRRQSEKVMAYEKEIAALTDEQLREKTVYFREQLKAGKTIEDIKFEAFAVAREAAKRTLGQFPFQVQIMGALVLNEGDVAEMRTGFMCNVHWHLLRFPL